MTDAEKVTESKYRITERLAISCGDKKPTMQEEMLAKMTVAKEMAQIEKLEDLDDVVKNW